MKLDEFFKICALGLSCMMIFATIWGVADCVITGSYSYVQFAVLLMGATVGPLVLYWCRSRVPIVVSALKKL